MRRTIVASSAAVAGGWSVSGTLFALDVHDEYRAEVPVGGRTPGSPISEVGGNVGIGTTSPFARLRVSAGYVILILAGRYEQLVRLLLGDGQQR